MPDNKPNWLIELEALRAALAWLEDYEPELVYNAREKFLLNQPLGKMHDDWITNETPARVLFVKSRGGLDPDCLVAYLEGSTKPLWIIEHSGYVCGLGLDSKITARRIVRPDWQKEALDAR